MRRQLVAAIATLMLAASPVLAANGNIGLFFDEGAAICQMAVPCGAPAVQLYVYGLLQGASLAGISGVEYRVTVSNGGAGWMFLEDYATHMPVTVGTGAFPPNGGLNGAWPACQVGDGTKVLLEVVTIINQGDCSGQEVTLSVVKHFSASNQFFQCPLFTMCDFPFFTKFCLGSDQRVCRNPEPPFAMDATCSTSGEAFLNPGPTRNCTVAVADASWSTIKGMYRD